MRPDYRRIHELEYELGFRDDPPPPDLVFGPGVVIRTDPAYFEEILLRDQFAGITGASGDDFSGEDDSSYVRECRARGLIVDS